MLKLYMKATCPFSNIVIKATEEIKVQLELLDITNDHKLREELIAKTGKKQTPYLEDTEKDSATDV